MNLREKFERLQSEQQNSVFYPQGYTVAVLPSATKIDEVLAALAANWKAEDLTAFSGAELLTWHSESEQNKDLIQRMQALVAELQGQETEYLKQFLDLARQGHQFVLIPTPEEADDQRMIEALKAFRPVKLSDYRAGGIVDLEIVQVK